MSGCANCVWLDYAEEVVKFYEVRGKSLDLQTLLQDIDKNISDEMIKESPKILSHDDNAWIESRSSSLGEGE